MQPSDQVKDLLVKKGISDEVDYLLLARIMGRMERCHALPIQHKPTVAAHSFQCVIMFDYFHRNGLITPALEESQWRAIRDWLLYHDFGETVVGDIPYFVAKLMGSLESDIHEHVVNRFIEVPKLSPDLYSLAKQFDMLEFLLTMMDDPMTGVKGPSQIFCAGPLRNAHEALEKAQEECNYKINYRKLLGRINGT